MAINLNEFKLTPKEQTEKLRSIDLNQYTLSEPKKEGIVSSLFRGITEPVVTMGVRPYQAAKAIMGATPYEQAVNLPYYGRIEAPMTGTDLKKDVGRAIETVALGYTGGAAGGIKTAAKAGIPNLLKQGAVQGAKVGGLFGLGAGLEETGTAGGTAKGAALGATGGAVLGFSTPFVGKAAGAVTKSVLGKVKGAGEWLTGLTMDPTDAEKTLMQSYNASKPTIIERISGLITGKKTVSPTKPTTLANTAVRIVAPGTEKGIGVNAERVSNKLWKNIIAPALKSVKEKVDMRTFFNDLRSEIISKNADLSRRHTLLKALYSFSGDFSRVSKIGYLKLQDYKSGWAKFIPERYYKGEPIAGALNEVRGMAANKARQLIYDKLGPQIKTAYMDWGNLQSLMKEAIKSNRSLDKLSITRAAWEMILDNALTPVTTIAGKVLYKTAAGIEFLGDAGAKILGDIFGKDFFQSTTPFGKDLTKIKTPIGMTIEDVTGGGFKQGANPPTTKSQIIKTDPKNYKSADILDGIAQYNPNEKEYLNNVLAFLEKYRNSKQ